MTAPSLRLITSAERAAVAPTPLRSVVLIGNYPPRRCGIATFTADVREALVCADPGLDCEVIAMTDAGQDYAYPPEVGFAIRQQEVDDYLQAAARINIARPDVVCVEHEFGIFGGPAGEHLLTLLEAIDRPVVSTLHTVLEDPAPDQRRVFDRLLARSAKLIVMAERGREFLTRVWGVDDAKIEVIPHGAPDRPLSDPASFKAGLGFEGRELLFTFGLLSPNKGIETVIRALPAIVAERPTALYAVLVGHPSPPRRAGRRTIPRLPQGVGRGVGRGRQPAPPGRVRRHRPPRGVPSGGGRLHHPLPEPRPDHLRNALLCGGAGKGDRLHPLLARRGAAGRRSRTADAVRRLRRHRRGGDRAPFRSGRDAGAA